VATVLTLVVIPLGCVSFSKAMCGACDEPESGNNTPSGTENINVKKHAGKKLARWLVTAFSATAHGLLLFYRAVRFLIATPLKALFRKAEVATGTAQAQPPVTSTAPEATTPVTEPTTKTPTDAQTRKKTAIKATSRTSKKPATNLPVSTKARKKPAKEVAETVSTATKGSKKTAKVVAKPKTRQTSSRVTPTIRKNTATKTKTTKSTASNKTRSASATRSSNRKAATTIAADKAKASPTKGTANKGHGQTTPDTSKEEPKPVIEKQATSQASSKPANRTKSRTKGRRGIRLKTPRNDTME